MSQCIHVRSACAIYLLEVAPDLPVDPVLPAEDLEEVPVLPVESPPDLADVEETLPVDRFPVLL